MISTDRGLLSGRYLIGDLLGDGATATVSRAFDQLLHREVAIKLLKPAFALDETLLERFYAEARAAAALVDPRIVGIYDIIADGSLHAIVMEFVDGPSLAQVLQREGRIGEKRVTAYAVRIAQALAAAHARGILHRDVKPGNVLLTHDDDVKVTDFGLAKAFAGDDPELTQAGQFVGSVHYFSPEQAQGLALTPASDLYSLGVVMYQLITGSLPFDASSPVSVAVAHVTAPAPSEGELARSMSPALATIVARLLQKDPHARFESAGELDAALAALEGAPPHDPAWDVGTIVGGAPVVPPRLARRHRVARVLAPVAAGLASAFTAAGTALARAASALPAMLATGLGAARRRAGPAFGRVGNNVRAATPEWLRDLTPQNTALAVSMLLVLVVMIAIAAWPRSFALADVRRAPLAQARSTLASLGLTTTVANRSDPAVQAGTVIAQRPAPHAAVRRGDAVQLIVSSGAPMATVPNLLGTSFAEAQRAMQHAKLRARFAARVAAVPANVVIEQYPPPGTRVRAGGPALVVISTGPQPPVVVTNPRGDGGD